jgi:hypothetical protein
MLLCSPMRRFLAIVVLDMIGLMGFLIGPTLEIRAGFLTGLFGAALACTWAPPSTWHKNFWLYTDASYLGAVVAGLVAGAPVLAALTTGLLPALVFGTAATIAMTFAEPQAPPGALVAVSPWSSKTRAVTPWYSLGLTACRRTISRVTHGTRMEVWRALDLTRRFRAASRTSRRRRGRTTRRWRLRWTTRARGTTGSGGSRRHEGRRRGERKV